MSNYYIKLRLFLIIQYADIRLCILITGHNTTGGSQDVM